MRDEKKIIGNYAVAKLIGKGGFGKILQVCDVSTNKVFAMKLEDKLAKKKALEREANVYKTLHSPFFPKFIKYSETNEYRFLIMELCGASLKSISKILPNKRFSISTVLHSGIEMLLAIESLHKHGYIHRDIKPSNFLIRPSRSNPITLVDFGLSCKYYKVENNQFHHGFVGTAKYASPNAHFGKELSRRDDLYSWFYSLIEMRVGRLPWSFSDREKLFYVKVTTDVRSLLSTFPPQMLSIYRLIRRLKFEDQPNYSLIISFMVEAMKECGASWEDKFDWENIDPKKVQEISIPLTPSNDIEKRRLPSGLPNPIMPPYQSN
ncbi:CK1 family protein kinase [Histomonas meleagridis]|uniref:CK1 family protein kinase n=1 Tax=Histomonas meleagridis TaxID=135588 RepID=UPI0035596C90|nr:CK1 family protein kinase [Histomonas meleagridis]KAH0805884.1 CK1 family protein kinase [Histomonas meleagridis]